MLWNVNQRDNEIMHIPKLHVPNSRHFLNGMNWHFDTEKKGQQKAKCNLGVLGKSNVNSHDNHDFAMLFYARKKLNANLIYYLKNNMQE